MNRYAVTCQPCGIGTIDEIDKLPDACPKCGREFAGLRAAKMAARLYPQHDPQFPMAPSDVRKDAQSAFGRASDDVSRSEFYASWSAYDAATQRMPAQQQALQARAEALELERMHRL